MALKKVTSLTSSIGNISVGTSDIGSTASANYFGSAVSNAGKSLQQKVRQSIATQNSFESDPEYKRFKSRNTILSQVNTADGIAKQIENWNNQITYARESGNEDMLKRSISDFEAQKEVFAARKTNALQNTAIANITNNAVSKIMNQEETLNKDPGLFFTALETEGLDFGLLYSNKELKEALGLNDEQYDDWLLTKAARDLDKTLNNKRIASLKKYNENQEKIQMNENKNNFKIQLPDYFKGKLDEEASVTNNLQNLKQAYIDTVEGNGIYRPETHGTLDITTLDREYGSQLSDLIVDYATRSEKPEEAYNIITNFLEERSGSINLNGQDITYKEFTEFLPENVEESLIADIKNNVSVAQGNYLKNKQNEIMTSGENANRNALSYSVVDARTKEHLEKLQVLIAESNLPTEQVMMEITNIITSTKVGDFSTMGVVTESIASFIIEKALSGTAEDFNATMGLLQSSMRFSRQEGVEWNFASVGNDGKIPADIKKLQDIFYKWNQSSFVDTAGVGNDLANVFSEIKMGDYRINVFNPELGDTGMGRIASSAVETIYDDYENKLLKMTTDRFFGPNFEKLRTDLSSEEFRNLIRTNSKLNGYIKEQVEYRLKNNIHADSPSEIIDKVVNDIENNFVFASVASGGFITKQEATYMNTLNFEEDIKDLKLQLDNRVLNNIVYTDDNDRSATLRKEDFELGKNIFIETFAEGIDSSTGEVIYEFVYTYSQNSGGMSMPIKDSDGLIIVSEARLPKQNTSNLTIDELNERKKRNDSSEINVVGSAINPAGFGNF